MNEFGRNGYPLGSTVQIVSCDDHTLIGRQCTILMQQQWVDAHQKWMYVVDVPIGNSKNCWISPSQLKLVYLPFSWQNWCQNKVIMLLAHNETIAKDLYNESGYQGD